MALTEQHSSPGLVPFRISPKFVGRVWGYQDLRPWYDRVAESGEPIGEVWLSGDECLVATGSYIGQELSQVFEKSAKAILGTGTPSMESPLLIKVIFAKEKLSVQVHPDDKMAQKYGEPRGKTECWYALAAGPGAKVAVGLKQGVTLDTIRDEIQDGTLEESLNVLPVTAGEMFLVDAGTVHAIWPGSILLETQQNSDLTYRMYDYGRPRELHIEKSLEAVRLQTRVVVIAAKTLEDRAILVDAEYFRVERLPVDGRRASSTLADKAEKNEGLAYLFAAAGTARLTGEDFEPIDLPIHGIVAVPATAPEFVIEDLGGLDLIRITPNWPKSNQ